ncbi:hypothetical protein SprV_0602095700 [Sparganum proliferum]
MVGGSDGGAVIAPTSNTRDEIAAINDGNVGHQTVITPSATVLDEGRCNRPERRTAPVDQELACYKLDIAAVSETHITEQGLLEEVGPGYIFFFSRRLKTERREAGVNSAIRNDIVRRLPCLPAGHQ